MGKFQKDRRPMKSDFFSKSKNGSSFDNDEESAFRKNQIKWKRSSFKDNNKKSENKGVKPVKNDSFFVTKENFTRTERSSKNNEVFNKKELSNKGKILNEELSKKEDNLENYNFKNSLINTLKRSIRNKGVPNARKSNFASTSGNFSVKPSINASPSTSSDQKDQIAVNSSKKQFDKKKWRMQKYSNKFKLERWEEKRKKAVLRDYYKDVKQKDKDGNVQKIYEKYDTVESDVVEISKGNEINENENNFNMDVSFKRNRSKDDDVSSRDWETASSRNKRDQENIEVEEEGVETNDCLESGSNKKRKAFKKAHEEYERIKEEKRKRKEELKKKRAERDEALKIYKQKKIDKFKRLNRKTKKGQPIMKERIELLLEKIQKTICD